jgi:ABC-type transport system involved in multi-copper enzyme maturation permease subunit
MTFLPIVERELRAAARRPTTYWLRSIAALGVVVLWLLLVIGNHQMRPTPLSQLLFTAFGVLALGFCLLAGIFLTADCLSEEKREGTLGLLFLTDLKGYDVVLGKLLATSLHSVYGLLSIFPILALPLLMGGVTAGAFWRVVLVLLVTVLLSLSLGMVISAFQNETRQAMAGTFLGMLVLTGVFPALWWWLVVVWRTRPNAALLLPSPGYAFSAALDPAYRGGAGRQDFWLSVELLFLLGVVFLAVASIALPRVWQQGQTSTTRGLFRFWRVGERSLTPALSPSPGCVGLRPGEEGERESPPPATGTWEDAQPRVRSGGRFRSALAAEVNPYFWLASRVRPGGASLPVALLLLVALWACFLVAAVVGGKKEAFIVCLIAAYALHQVVKYNLAVEATRRLSEDKRSGVLELLLVTRLPEEDILSGLKRALERQFGRAIWLLASVNVVMCGAVLFFSRALGMNTEDQAIFMELFLGGQLMLWLDFRTMCVVGMRAALRSKKHHRAVLGTIARVLVPPWAALFVMVFVGQSLRLNAGGAATLFALWFGLGILTDAIVAAQARVDLARGIRACLLGPPPRATGPAPPVLSSQLRPQRA